MNKKTVYLISLIIALVGLVFLLLRFLIPQGESFSMKFDNITYAVPGALTMTERGPLSL